MNCTWKREGEHLVLYQELDDGHCQEVYSVNLLRCTTSAETLDWIFQVSSKSYVTPEVLGQFVRELDAILDPQMTLCSGGVERGPVVVEAIVPVVAFVHDLSRLIANRLSRGKQ